VTPFRQTIEQTKTAFSIFCSFGKSELLTYVYVALTKFRWEEFTQQIIQFIFYTVFIFLRHI